ncbi:glycosyltransferase family protein [Azospirillum sp. sgz302134]
MPTILMYCQVSYGAGHWVRTAALASELLRRFRVVLAVRGTPGTDAVPAPGVEIRQLNDDVTLAGLVERERPAAIVVEYFPFGRQEAADELLPVLDRARRTPQPPVVLCSLRDVQQCRRRQQQAFDARVCEIVNGVFDAVLIHSDPTLFALEMTFARAGDLRVPVLHTGYVVPDSPVRPWPGPPEEPRVLVSVGGGRGGEDLLRAALQAQRSGLAEDFAMRVLAGAYLREEDWTALQEMARGVPRLELVRWSTDLPAEMAAASVSVSRCGYNTALDLLRTRPPALVVPYATPTQDEQTRRAMKLARLGAVRWLSPDRASPERLAEEIRRTADFRPAPLDIDLDGARRSAALVADLIKQAPAC